MGFNDYLAIGKVAGLDDVEQQDLDTLVDVFNRHRSNNNIKDKYYDGMITLSDVNLGIAIPDSMKNIEFDCGWGAKAVDVLASRSMFDGFVGTGGKNSDSVNAIVERNNLIYEYSKACTDELKYGCTFATLSEDEDGLTAIRFHSPRSAAALWNGEKGRIGCGLAIIDEVYDEAQSNYLPSLVNYYTDEFTIVLERIGGRWEPEFHENNLGRPLMEPLIWNPTTGKPFGRSRIDSPVRNLINNYVGVMADMRIAVEFDTAPQKYLLGVTDEQFDSIVNNKFKNYVGSVLAATANPETGQNPQFGQLSQGNIEPHVQAIRLIATQFCAITSLPVTDVGIINDANPTSSDAILAQTQSLVSLAEKLNAGNGIALVNIIKMAMELDGIEIDESIIAHFRNPAMPSVSVTADAAIKIASARQGFSTTDVFLEMIGFDQADIRRIRAQEREAVGRQLLSNEFSQIAQNTLNGNQPNADKEQNSGNSNENITS